LVSDKLSTVPLPNSSTNSNRKWREQTVYQGGELRIPNDSGSMHAAFAFEGLSFKDSIPLLLARKILGQNRQRGRLQKNIMAKNPFIDNA